MKITDRWLKNKGACSDAIKRLSEEKNRDEIYLINKHLRKRGNNENKKDV